MPPLIIMLSLIWARESLIWARDFDCGPLIPWTDDRVLPYLAGTYPRVREAAHGRHRRALVWRPVRRLLALDGA